MPANEMDAECVALCGAINLINGIRTVESCCGHGETPYHISFRADCLRSLPGLLYWFDGFYCGYYGWHVKVFQKDATEPVTFVIEGPVGERAYKEAEHIASLIDRKLTEQGVRLPLLP